MEPQVAVLKYLGIQKNASEFVPAKKKTFIFQKMMKKRT